MYYSYYFYYITNTTTTPNTTATAATANILLLPLLLLLFKFLSRLPQLRSRRRPQNPAEPKTKNQASTLSLWTPRSPLSRICPHSEKGAISPEGVDVPPTFGGLGEKVVRRFLLGLQRLGPHLGARARRSPCSHSSGVRPRQCAPSRPHSCCPSRKEDVRSSGRAPHRLPRIPA